MQLNFKLSQETAYKLQSVKKSRHAIQCQLMIYKWQQKMTCVPVKFCHVNLVSVKH